MSAGSLSYNSEADASSSGSLVLQVAEIVEGMIIDGVLSPGGKLNENTLSRDLKVSRSTLREAIRQLEKMGLARVIPKRGVFVRQVSLREALNLFDIRAGLARVAGRLLAVRVTPDQEAILYGLHEKMISSWREADLSEYFISNYQFHQKLMGFSGNVRLAELDEMMSKELYLFRRRNLGNLSQLEMSIQEHEKILQGVSLHEQDKAGLAFERHIIAGKQRMLDALPE